MRSFLFALALLFSQSASAQVGLPFPGPGGTRPPITVPVSLGSGTSASTSTNSITTGITVPNGGRIFVAANFVKSTTISISSIADSAGNTYTAAVTAGWDATNNDNQELWSAPAPSGLASGSTILVTLTATPNAANPWPMVAMYATGLISAALDKTVSTKYPTCASCTLASGSSTTLSQANELAVGALGFYGPVPTITEGSGFTQVVDLSSGGSNNLRAHLAYQIVAATTAINYQPSVNTSVFGGSMLATFKGN